MTLRQEFVTLAAQEGANISALCRRFGISRKTARKWRQRAMTDGPAGLVDRARRPYTSPTRTPAALEDQVVALRDAHPNWGGRKLRRVLQDQGEPLVPSPSTITGILARQGRLAAPDPSRRATPPASGPFPLGPG